MIGIISLVVTLGASSIQPGYVFESGPAEGMIAGQSVETEDGFWLVDVEFGPVGQSPVDKDRATMVGSLFSGELILSDVTHNNCSMTEERDVPLCRSSMGGRVAAPIGCTQRDMYAYHSMDAVRVEWSCDGKEDAYSVVNFSDGKITLVRTLNGMMPVPIKKAA